VTDSIYNHSNSICSNSTSNLYEVEYYQVQNHFIIIIIIFEYTV